MGNGCRAGEGCISYQPIPKCKSFIRIINGRDHKQVSILCSKLPRILPTWHMYHPPARPSILTCIPYLLATSGKEDGWTDGWMGKRAAGMHGLEKKTGRKLLL